MPDLIDSKVGVLILTCNRPAFLREALESVRRQTARDRIAQVVVSENSANGDSEDLCRQFPDLPIDYVRQTPPVPALFHLTAVWPLIRHENVAFLHDDDWWAPEHLQAALAAFDSNPGCVGCFSSYYETADARRPFQLDPIKAWRVWASTSCSFQPALVLDDVGMLLINLLDSTFHYSTFVGRNVPTWQASQRVAASGNAYDNDRLFPVYLSAHGSVAYVTRPDVFVRVHPEQDSARFERIKQHWFLKRETSRRLLAESREAAARAADRFNAAVAGLDEHDFFKVADAIGEPQKTFLIEECGLRLTRIAEEPQPARDLRWYVTQVCPPVFLAGMRRLARLAAGNRSA
jgi:glycosyltransferase involved in cell wall biosynthesis